MTTDRFLAALEQAWRPAREMGALGGVPLKELCDHAAGFIPAAFRVESEVKCLDMGTGVGIPGLFLAHLLPRSVWTLLDASERRCEVAARAVEAVGLTERVSVVHGRADDLSHDARYRRCHDLVVSRLFGDVSETAECGLPLVDVGGLLVVSCLSEAVKLWSDADWSLLGGRFGGSWRLDAGSFVCVVGVEGLERKYPRRPASRRRSPLLAP